MNEAETGRVMSNFTFMAEWPELQEPAGKAELLAQADPRAACFYARFAMEHAVQWVYRCHWLYRNYSRQQPVANQLFDPALIPAPIEAQARQSAKQLLALRAQLHKQDEETVKALAEREKQNAVLREEFKGEKEPLDPDIPLTIAMSVDMLDTVIDVPEVVNLVFFKVVQSRVKFVQMLGRGTRLCPDLFGPGENKQEFIVFDYCQNLEYFEENPDGAKDSGNRPLPELIFEKRLQLATVLAKSEFETDQEFRRYTLDLLHHAVAGRWSISRIIWGPKPAFPT